MRNVESFKLGVVIEANGRQAKSELKSVDDATTKTTTSFQKLGVEMKKTGGLASGFSAGFKSAATGFTKQIEQFSKSSRLNAIGNIVGSTVGSGMQDGIMSVISNLGSTVGSLIGTAIAPGIGTAVGSTVGSAVDSALAKVSGTVGPLIQKGLDYNKRLELEMIHYTTFTGSLAEAKKHIDFLKKESMVSFDLPTWLASSQRLEEFNNDIKLTQLELKAVKDQTAVFRPDDLGYFNALIDTLGLITERGELTSRELNKIRRMGLDVPQMLSEETGWSTKKIEQMIKAGELDGQITARLIATNIERHKGGFADLIDSSTLAGREGSFKEGLNQRAQEALVSTAQKMSQIYKGANDLVSGPGGDKLVQFINSTAETLFGTIEKAVNIGASVTGGVVTGIQSGEALNSLKSAITGMGNAALDTLRELWQINSPSKVFADIGGDAVEGLADGYGGQGGFRSAGSKEYLRGAIAELLNGANSQVLGWAKSLGLNKGQAAVFENMQKLFAREPDFLPMLIQGAQARGMNPDHLLNVMAIESGFIKNNQNRFGYTGLIQLGDKERREAGMPQETWGVKGRSAAKSYLGQISAAQQLDYVFRWLDSRAKGQRLDTQAKLYATVGAGSYTGNDATVRWRRGSNEYKNNPLWDVNHDGRIQNWEFGPAAMSKLGAGANFSVNDGALPVRVVGGAPALTNQQRFFNNSLAELKSSMPSDFALNQMSERKLVGAAGDGLAATPVRLAQELPKAFDKLNTNLGQINLTFPDTEAFFKRLDSTGVQVVGVFGELGTGVPPVTDALNDLKKVGVKASAAEQQKVREEYKRKREQEGEEGSFNHRRFPTRDEKGIRIGPAKQAVAGLKAAYKEVKAMGHEAFDQFASGVGSLVENFVLLGTTGPDALRKLAAQAVASLAAQATVQAVYWTAQGIVDLFFNPARAAADFAGAALFASIAGLSIVGGRALAGNRFQDRNGQSQAEQNQQYGDENYSGNKFQRRATGGSAYRGRAYIVGDGGRPEVFEPTEDGYVHSSIAAYQRSQRGRSENGSGSSGSARSDAAMERIADALDRLESAPPEHWLLMAARRDPGAIGAANVAALRKNSDLVNQTGRALNLA